MRILLIIIMCFSGLFGLAQPVPATLSASPERNVRMDSMLRLAVHYMEQYTYAAGPLAKKVYSESRKEGYVHGMALSLACMAGYNAYVFNNFMLSEQQLKQSLDYFGRTNNKEHLTAAYGLLGFVLFAQSRFDDALRYLRQGLDEGRRTGDTVGIATSLSLIGCTYRESGDYEKAFEFFRRCLQMTDAIHDTQLAGQQYLQLGELFTQVEDYPTARKYFHTGFGLAKDKLNSAWTSMVFAELLSRMHLFDSARFYYDRFDSVHSCPAMLRSYLVSKGEYFLQQEHYREALPYFDKSLVVQRRLNDRNQLMRCLKDLSITYQHMGMDREALRYARESLAIATQFKARQFIRDNCRILYCLYDKAGRTDSAYVYYRAYNNMKDSVNAEQLKGKFASYTFEQQIALLSKEKQLQDVCLREEMLTKNLLIGGIIALLLFGFIFSRYVMLKRKNEAHRRKRAENELDIQRLEGEKAKSALQQRAKELEVQALRSQMNPHFIFNCLNAINRFVLSHETEAAGDYLTKFSRLMRMTMNHSRHALITLSEELEVLQLYLDMERLRFGNAFDYTITPADEIEAGDIYMPPLLLQPFIENAIWHGLMHKQERGHLSIDLQVDGDILTCIIRDNGIGRQKAGLLKSKSAEKHKSMGLQITAERLALMTGKGEAKHYFSIEDLYDEHGQPAGTQVTLTIRINSHVDIPV